MQRCSRRDCGFFVVGVLVTAVFFTSEHLGLGSLAAIGKHSAVLEVAVATPQVPATGQHSETEQGASLVAATDRLQAATENNKPPDTQPTESKPPQPRAVPSAALCEKEKVAPSSALELFCQEAPGYPEIWAEGMLTLGEEALLDFVQHWELHGTQLGGKELSVWYDRRDLKAKPMLREQAADNYGLQQRLRHAGDKWILDFGGNAGFTAICEARFAPHAHVLTIEPSPWTYLVLRANLAQAKLHERVIALRGGMGGQTGSLQGVHYFAASAGVSLRADEKIADRPGAFTSPIFTLPELIKKYSIHQIALVKLDCEGCEYSSVRDWLQTGLARRIPKMVGEYHHSAGSTAWTKDWPLAESKRLYKFMCGSPGIDMHKGCKHGRLDPLHWQYVPSGER